MHPAKRIIHLFSRTPTISIEDESALLRIIEAHWRGVPSELPQDQEEILEALERKYLS